MSVDLWVCGGVVLTITWSALLGAIGSYWFWRLFWGLWLWLWLWLVVEEEEFVLGVQVELATPLNAQAIEWSWLGIEKGRRSLPLSPSPSPPSLPHRYIAVGFTTRATGTQRLS